MIIYTVGDSLSRIYHQLGNVMACDLYGTNESIATQPARGNVENKLSDELRNDLVEMVIPWCKKLASDHYRKISSDRKRFDEDELQSEAFVAACNAAKYYDEKRGVAFTTYVRQWVTTHLTSYTSPTRPINQTTLASVGIESPESVLDHDRDEDDTICFEPVKPDVDQSRLLGYLPENTREIARLCVFEKLSPDRIALQLNIPVKDVKLHMRNAFAKLADIVARDAEPSLWTVGQQEGVNDEAEK